MVRHPPEPPLQAASHIHTRNQAPGRRIRPWRELLTRLSGETQAGL